MFGRTILRKTKGENNGQEETLRVKVLLMWRHLRPQFMSVYKFREKFHQKILVKVYENSAYVLVVVLNL